ncbi:hypothetical protein [Nocardioides sp.]|jgi:hypothetical protein|uniref:hypothetical protein n=1 Tax=Nocardioides sp. TaxID=35761 RepID=UPI0026192054|nr:hypothetical protein [Nocardioides sp.]
MRWDDQDLQDLLRWRQHGTVRRSQLLALGGTTDDVARFLRRRELSPVHPGVYVDHTGPLTTKQREWCAVHVHWPASLTGLSALPDPPRGVVHVAIDERRTVRRIAGIVAHRTAGLDARTDWLKDPPRIALAHALIDVMSTSREDRAFELLTRAVNTRETWPQQLRDTLASRARVRQRAVLLGLIDDVESGACSVLERGYLHAVERRHGLPTGERQRRFENQRGRGYRDVVYRAFGLIVELDGRAFHNSVPAWNAAYDRDLDAAVDDVTRTARISYSQVFGSATAPCQTAARIGVLLQRGGWSGTPLRCPDCPATRSGGAGA